MITASPKPHPIPAFQKPTPPGGEHWAVCQVFSKRAARLVSEANDLVGCTGFIPRYARVRYVDGQRSSNMRQLMPGYLFVKVRPDDRALIAELEGVYRILPGTVVGASRLDYQVDRLLIDSEGGAFNELEAPPAERVRRRRRRPRPGRRMRARLAAQRATVGA